MANIMLKKIVGGGSVATMTNETFFGSDCSGVDGAASRVLATANVDKAKGSPIVFIDGAMIRQTLEYTITGKNITFIINIWNDSRIDVGYVQ